MMARLPDFLKRQKLDRTSATIVLVDFCPRIDASSKRVLIEPTAGKVSAEDTKVVSWLRAAVPNLTIVCVRVTLVDNRPALTEAIEKGLKYEPTAVYVPASSLTGDIEGISALLDKCWRSRCLVFTVIPWSNNSSCVPVGVFTLALDQGSERVRNEADSEGRHGIQERTKLPRGVVVSQRLLSDGLSPPKGTAATKYAAAYVAAVLAVLPQEGFARHLEHTARIALSGPVGKRDRCIDSSYREFNVRNAIVPGDHKFDFGDQTFAWDDKVGDLDSSKIIRENIEAESDEEKTRRIIVAVQAQAYMRWLAAAAILLDLRPILFVPTKGQGVVVFQPRPRHMDKAASKLAFGLLSTQKRSPQQPDTHYIVNVVFREGFNNKKEEE